MYLKTFSSLISCRLHSGTHSSPIGGSSAQYVCQLKKKKTHRLWLCKLLNKKKWLKGMEDNTALPNFLMAA